MNSTRPFVRYALADTDSKFNFTMDPVTGELIVPEGIPPGTLLSYVQRTHYDDGRDPEDLPKTFTVS